MTGTADDRRKDAADASAAGASAPSQSAPSQSGVSHAGDTLVAPRSIAPVHITGGDLVAPTLHASPGGAPADLLPGTILDGVYRVEKEIGRGAMGTVYLVEHLRLGRKFAAKVVSLRHTENTEIASRLQNEARVASRVQHENIVDVTHLGQTGSGALFIVMELLSGKDLRELMQKRIDAGEPRWLPDAQIRAIVSDVMAGLAAAHAAGIVHRDLKPDNIFVVEKGGRLRAKIVDFGISRSSESEDLRLTRDGQIIGTPLYMAPEQARGGPTVDARADLYSLGVVCHELLTGALPFHATSVYDMIIKHATEPPPPVRATRPDLSVALEEALLKSLAKKPGDRFQSVEEMRAAWDASWPEEASPERGPSNPSQTGRRAAVAPGASQTGPRVAVDATPASAAVVSREAAPPPARGRLALVGVAVLVVLASGIVLVRSGQSTVTSTVTDHSVTISSTPPATAEEEARTTDVPPVGAPSIADELRDVPVGPEATVTTVVAQRMLISDPPGATVSIAGAEVGTTPCPVEVGDAPIEVDVRMRGYRREVVTMSGGSIEPVRVTLRRSARDAPPALAPR